MQRGEGSRIFDADGNTYVDYVMSYGPLVLGHAYQSVVEALEKAVRDGTTFGAPTELEVELAELVCEVVPSIDPQVRRQLPRSRRRPARRGGLRCRDPRST